MSCCAIHSPGQCCHYGEKEIPLGYSTIAAVIHGLTDLAQSNLDITEEDAIRFYMEFA